MNDQQPQPSGAPSPAPDDGPRAMALDDDPADFTVDQVNDYLAGVDDVERMRVLTAEKYGEGAKQRAGIIGQDDAAGDDPAPRAKVYAAYDTTFQRFVGGTHSTEAKAREAAKDKGAGKVEIREV